MRLARDVGEDLPREDNRVTLDGAGRIVVRYRQNNVKAHRELVVEMKRILARLGLRFPVTHSLDSTNTTHQCGTLCFGADPRISVLDPFCRAHDVSNLFVVDASFFPSSAAVNPGLTIAAQALRVADYIMDERPRHQTESREPSPEPNMRARSFSHVGITVSDFNKAVPVLLGRVRMSARGCCRYTTGARANVLRCRRRRAELQDRLDSRPGRRRARDLRVQTAARSHPGSVEPGWPHAHLVQRPRARSLAPVLTEQGRRLCQ